MVEGPDGNFWIVDIEAKAIDMFNPTSQSTTKFNMPGGGGTIRGIAIGPDGNIWFTDSGANAVGTINLTTHAVSEFLVPTPNAGVDAITAGPNGNLWFVESNADQLGSINPTTHAIAEYSLSPQVGLLSGPFEVDLTAGPDGNLWMTGPAENAIFQFNIATHQLKELSIPNPFADPEGITTGPDGNLWFTDGPSSIGTINPTTDAISVFPLPSNPSGNFDLPEGITAGPDGNIWFANLGGNSIGMIDPTTHAITEFPIPSTGSGEIGSTAPFAIVAGPNGTIGFTLSQSDQIGVINLNPANSGSSGSTAGTVPVSTSAANTPPAPGSPSGSTIGPNSGSVSAAPQHDDTITLDLGNSPTTGGDALSFAATNGVTAFSGLTVRRLGHGARYTILAGKGALITTPQASRQFERPSMLARVKLLTFGKGRSMHVLGVRLVLAKGLEPDVASDMLNHTAAIPGGRQSRSVALQVSYQTPAGTESLVLNGQVKVAPTGQIVVVAKT
jgi:streptogramin lyase